MTTEHRDMEELIAAYSLDAMDAGEQERSNVTLLEHLAGCASCRQTFHEMKEVTQDLALAAVPLPVSDALENRILAAVRSEGRGSADVRRRSWPLRLTGVAAAVIILAVGAWNLRIANDLRHERAVTARALSLTNDATATRVALQPQGQNGSASIVIRSDGRAYLVVAGLRSPGSGRVYELWFIKDGNPTRASVFTTHNEISVIALGLDPSNFGSGAITVEPGPHGSTRPTTPAIFAGSLPA